MELSYGEQMENINAIPPKLAKCRRPPTNDALTTLVHAEANGSFSISNVL